MKYFDTHCHTNLEPLLANADSVIKECQESQIILNVVGADLESSVIAVEQANQYDYVYATIGIHPTEIKQDFDYESVFKQFDELLSDNNKHIIGIGETGFDFHYPGYLKELQEAFFIRHIEIAKKHRLPLVVHTRDATDDTIRVLKENAQGLKVIIHCFDGDTNDVVKFNELGVYYGIGGKITHKKSGYLVEALKLIPHDKLLIETDAP
jgi:TatD DNase family protein